MTKRRRRLIVPLLAATALLASGCGDDGVAGSTTVGGAAMAEATTTVRLGYFPNVTHASAIVGVEMGLLAEKLGANKLETKILKAGPDAVTAILAGAIDAAYIGPNPAINAFAQSNGEAIRIVSGATSAGAFLVVKPEINSAADLKGKKVATPQLGNTQDVALRYWLKQQGFKTDAQGGGYVSVVPQDNGQTLETFKSGAVHGAWVPEPWGTRIIQEGGGKILLEEGTLWPDGQFVTTHLIVSIKFLNNHPDAVKRLIEGQIAANDFIAKRPDDAKKVVNEGITKYTGKGIAPVIIDAAWKNLTFTNDPIASSLIASARHAEEVGLLKPTKLDGIYDLTMLNAVLHTAKLPEVRS
ncbi:MAG TPA: ABC transporter substrate-binding protein [Acidimicrobiales bacterium]|nr:ABC transporter substrate-binding protein [Acidimicrobiales bacterium]